MNIEKPLKELSYQKLEALNSFENQVSIEFFQELLSNPYQFIRIEAIRRVRDYARQDFIRLFGIALNDRCDSVVEEAAQALAKINTDAALEILSNAFFHNVIERPHHIANAISQFGQRGFEVLLKGTKSTSPNIRYYSAKLLGSTNFEAAKIILEDMEKNDNEKTTFGGLVSTAARKGLKTLSKKLDAESSKYQNQKS